MERRAIKLTALVVILSILSVISGFSVYYVTNSVGSLLAFITLTSLLLLHIFLESSLSYELSFLYSVITMILSTIIVALTYYNKINGILIYQNNIHLSIFLYWMIPMVYNTFRCLFDKGPRFAAFTSYFWKTSALFAVYQYVYPH